MAGAVWDEDGVRDDLRAYLDVRDAVAGLGLPPDVVGPSERALPIGD